MQRINLYQDHLKRRTDPLGARRLALLLIVLGTALIAISGFQSWRASTAQAKAEAAVAEREAANARLEALRSELAAQPDASDRRQRMREELAAKRALLEYLDEGPFAEGGGFSGYLDGLARQMIDGVWLSRVELAGGGARMRLDGHALAPERVPELMSALGQAPAFAGRSFRRLAIERPDDADWRLDFVLASGAGEGSS